MLIKDFYTVDSVTEISTGKHTADITLNPNHPIFGGHFPGNPVTPGVCMMQIIKELTQEIVGSKLQMTSAANVKFMALINPEQTPKLKLDLNIDYPSPESVRVKNTTTFGDTVALKLSNTFKKTDN
ncbi:MAG: 3-hydroxyacyl-ACP dehydratase [Flavobacterium sp.]|nr:3-hydroxyacyl-ACP dehydratase [Flavobacterium sp.]